MISVFRSYKKSVIGTKWEMTNIDYKVNKEANFNIVIDKAHEFEEQYQQALKALNGKFDLIMCTTGTSGSGTIENSNIFAEVEKSLKENLYPALLASRIATTCLHEMGSLIFCGSLACYNENTPKMIDNAIGKNTLHSLALNMSKREGLSSEAFVWCLLLDVLNTEVNRKAMPKANFKEWITPREVSETVLYWAKGKNTPVNGSFIKFKKTDKNLVQEYL